MSGHLKYNVGIYEGIASQETMRKLKEWRHTTQTIDLTDLFEQKRRPSIVLVSNQIAPLLISAYWEILKLRQSVKALVELPVFVLILFDRDNYPASPDLKNTFHHVARTPEELSEMLSSVELRCPKKDSLGLKAYTEVLAA